MLNPATASIAAANRGQIQRCCRIRPKPNDKPRVTRVTAADLIDGRLLVLRRGKRNNYVVRVA